MGNINDSSHRLDDTPIPHLSELRRAPVRYRHILPLPFMKRYQCLVVGAASGNLTIAITDTHHLEVIESVHKYTGKRVFPVLIDPRRMQLLLQRIERCERCSRTFSFKGNGEKSIECYRYKLQRLEIDSLVMSITSQIARGLR